jgi:hypothetical protein
LSPFGDPYRGPPMPSGPGPCKRCYPCYRLTLTLQQTPFFVFPDPPMACMVPLLGPQKGPFLGPQKGPFEYPFEAPSFISFYFSFFFLPRHQLDLPLLSQATSWNACYQSNLNTWAPERKRINLRVSKRTIKPLQMEQLILSLLVHARN